jgi:hypothetical protein
MEMLTVLTVYLVQQLQHLENEVIPSCCHRKTVETVTKRSGLTTGLKPGENDINKTAQIEDRRTKPKGQSRKTTARKNPQSNSLISANNLIFGR